MLMKRDEFNQGWNNRIRRGLTIAADIYHYPDIQPEI